MLTNTEKTALKKLRGRKKKVPIEVAKVMVRFPGTFLTRAEWEALAKRFVKIKKNPSAGAEKIYDHILAIEAKKGKKSLWPKEKFRHDFSSKDAEILGLSDGSILVKSKSGKRLWKRFNYE